MRVHGPEKEREKRGYVGERGGQGEGRGQKRVSMWGEKKTREIDSTERRDQLGG